MLMTATEFCIWLKRFLDGRHDPLTRDEIMAIRQHLGNVFVHEIDPGMGDAAHQIALREIHGGLDH
jgi:hypothetical protein